LAEIICPSTCEILLRVAHHNSPEAAPQNYNRKITMTPDREEAEIYCRPNI
jgi:hypothetical protein